jgi:hypothetical protein
MMCALDGAETPITQELNSFAFDDNLLGVMRIFAFGVKP